MENQKINWNLIVSMIAVTVSIISLYQTNKNTINNTQMQIASHIINSRPSINAGMSEYDGRSKILSLSKNNVKGQKLPYIENSSNNVAENVIVMAVYKRSKSSKYICEYAQLSSLFPKERVFINTFPLEKEFQKIQLQYYSTAQEKIQQSILFKSNDSSLPGTQSHFIVSHSNFFDNGKNVNYIKKFNNSNITVSDYDLMGDYEYSVNVNLQKNIKYVKMSVYE